MGKFEAHTTHTATLSWDSGATLEKEELISGIKHVIPDSAIITEMTVGDCLVPQPEIAGPKARRTLTIAYIENPALARYRRP